MPCVIITFAINYHMWVVGATQMLKHMNKDVYLHVAKSQPLPFHVQDNSINKIIVYYVGDMWQHTIGTKCLPIWFQISYR